MATVSPTDPGAAGLGNYDDFAEGSVLVCIGDEDGDKGGSLVGRYYLRIESGVVDLQTGTVWDSDNTVELAILDALTFQLSDPVTLSN